jgi:hypothetical protein
MVRHQAICVAKPIVPFNDMLERVQKVLTVGIVFEDGFLFVAARGHVIDCTGVFYAKRARHGAIISQEMANCNEIDLTLMVP